MQHQPKHQHKNRDQLGPCSRIRYALPVGFTMLALCAIGLAASQPVGVGSKVTFYATADGTLPITFKWYKDGNLIAVGSSYVIQAVTLADAGNYYVNASNIAGNADSAIETLIVLEREKPKAPTITDVQIDKTLDVP